MMSAATALPARLVIATRRSALALWQAEHGRSRLAALFPSRSIELLGLTTQGDRVTDQPLADIGGKGLFIKELEQAMRDGRADLAVHSLKDVPEDMPARRRRPWTQGGAGGRAGGFSGGGDQARGGPAHCLGVGPVPPFARAPAG